VSRSVLSKRATHNALLRYRTADDPVVIEAASDLKAARLADHIRRDVADTHDVDAWAAGVAESLDPLTPHEAAAVGRLAAALDARRPVEKTEAAAA
jgi:hypothetical protein